MRATRLLTAVLLLVLFVPTPTPATALAAVRAPGPVFQVHPSVNIETWFRWNNKVKSWDDYLTDADIAELVDLGFGTVRLSLFPQYFMRGDGDLRMRRWGYVERAVDRLTSGGLTVVVDLHTEHQVMEPYTSDASYRKSYQHFVGLVAAQLDDDEPAEVALSLMNEPHDTQGRWDTWQRRLHRVAREAAPDTTLVLTSDDWGSVRALLSGTRVIADPNVIWDAHLYEPFVFTHQGATWVGYPELAFRGVPYPSSPAKVRPAIARSLRASPPEWDQRVRGDLEQYGRQRWNRQRIERIMRRLAMWSSEHGDAAVWIGEFGVHSAAPRVSAYRWWRHVRLEAGQHGVGWSTWFWWDYARKHGKGSYDRRLARALGLDVTARTEP